MFKATIDWESAHAQTRTVEATCSGELIERDTDGCVLRVHTLPSIFEKKEIVRPVKVSAPAGFPPAVPCAPSAPKPVKMNSTLFDQLLTQLKNEAHGNNRNQKLTSMEIHERLLAMKE